MKYKNITDVLPVDLVDRIQNYIQGEYVYIPRREKNTGRNETAYQQELQKRNANISLKVLEGVPKKELAVMYNLSESSIRRIVLQHRKENIQMQEKIAKVLGEWGVEASEIKQIYDSAWQIEENYVLKVYDNCTDLERNIKVMELLLATEMGRVLGELHLALAEIEQGETFWDNSLLAELKGWIGDSFEENHWNL